MTARDHLRVMDLIPGDRVTGLQFDACFIAATQHPLWPHLRLVTWRLADGSFSLDALNNAQVIGPLSSPTDPAIRRARLRAALTETGTPWTEVTASEPTPIDVLVQEAARKGLAS